MLAIADLALAPQKSVPQRSHLGSAKRATEQPPARVLASVLHRSLLAALLRQVRWRPILLQTESLPGSRVGHPQSVVPATPTRPNMDQRALHEGTAKISCWEAPRRERPPTFRNNETWETGCAIPCCTSPSPRRATRPERRNIHVECVQEGVEHEDRRSDSWEEAAEM